MSEDPAFWALYAGLDREGPGQPADVVWAVDCLDLSGPLTIFDAGCGSGADTETLARVLPEARIKAVEKAPQLAQRAAGRCSDLANVSVRTGDMMNLEGPVDLIWCAGAIYFAGITEALVRWRAVLANGGAVAFSEPVLMPGEVSQAEREFWADYPAITDLGGINRRVKAAGYEVIASRPIVGAAWEAYYASMEARIDELVKGNVSSALHDVLESGRKEISGWRAAPDRIAYMLVIVRPA